MLVSGVMVYQYPTAATGVYLEYLISGTKYSFRISFLPSKVRLFSKTVKFILPQSQQSPSSAALVFPSICDVVARFPFFNPV